MLFAAAPGQDVTCIFADEIITCLEFGEFVETRVRLHDGLV